jgi:Sad1 / UNC-like C-terminal
VVFYPIWIHPILSSTVALSDFLVSTIYRRTGRRGSSRNNDVHWNGVATTDEILSQMVGTVQQLEQELHTMVQQEQKSHQQWSEWTLAMTQQEEDGDGHTNRNNGNIAETLRQYEVMIQNRIVELSKTVQQLQSYNSTTRLEIIQQQQEQEHRNKDRSRNVFLLDLSRSDFFDAITTSGIGTRNTSHTNNTNTSVQCHDDNNTTNDGDQSQSPLLQHHEMDVALQDLQSQIRDMIYTTIMSSSSTMKQIRNWIHDEIRNETLILKQRHGATVGGSHKEDDAVVRTIVAQRLLEKQSDVEWHKNDNDGNANIDYASIVQGGTILFATHSLIHTLPIMNRILSFLQLRFYGHTAEMILTPKLSEAPRANHPNGVTVLGQCWSFLRSKPAMVVIQMGQSIDVSSISIEHPFLSTTDTAIQTFHVYGHEDISTNRDEQKQQQFLKHIPNLLSDNSTKQDDGWYYLGTFVYDISKSIPGTNGLVDFPISKENNPDSPIPPLRILRLHIDPIMDTTTTKSKYQYSCLYRLRVYGEPSSSSTTQLQP